MIRGIRDVKEAGHRGAQKEAQDWAEDANSPKGIMRQKVLNFLEMAGYGRFLLASEDRGRPLVPLASGRKVSDEGESWTHWAVFSLAEYRAWAKTFEEDDLTSSRDDTDVCPNCGRVGYESRTGGHCCPGCGDIYWTRGDRIEELASQLLGGACKSYSGPGRAFSDSPWARVTRTRILVKQRGGLDV